MCSYLKFFQKLQPCLVFFLGSCVILFLIRCLDFFLTNCLVLFPMNCLVLILASSFVLLIEFPFPTFYLAWQHFECPPPRICQASESLTQIKESTWCLWEIPQESILESCKLQTFPQLPAQTPTPPTLTRQILHLFCIKTLVDLEFVEFFRLQTSLAWIFGHHGIFLPWKGVIMTVVWNDRWPPLGDHELARTLTTAWPDDFTRVASPLAPGERFGEGWTGWY